MSEKCKTTDIPLDTNLHPVCIRNNFLIPSEVFSRATIDFGHYPSAPSAKSYFAYAQLIHPSAVKQSNLKISNSEKKSEIV